MRPRAIGLLDLMVLIAAFAAALFLNRMNWPLIFPWGVWAIPGPTTRVRAYLAIQGMLAIVFPHLVTLTFAVAVIRWRRPRPSLRRIARQPGTVAGFVACPCVLVILGWIGANILLGGEVRFRIEDVSWSPSSGSYRLQNVHGPVWEEGFRAYADRIGFAVGGGWLCLLLGGRWRRERGSIDLLGYALGWLWIGVSAVIWLGTWLA